MILPKGSKLVIIFPITPLYLYIWENELTEAEMNNHTLFFGVQKHIAIQGIVTSALYSDQVMNGINETNTSFGFGVGNYRFFVSLPLVCSNFF